MGYRLRRNARRPLQTADLLTLRIVRMFVISDRGAPYKSRPSISLSKSADFFMDRTRPFGRPPFLQHLLVEAQIRHHSRRGGLSHGVSLVCMGGSVVSLVGSASKTPATPHHCSCQPFSPVFRDQPHGALKCGRPAPVRRLCVLRRRLNISGWGDLATRPSRGFAFWG
jgi:hypothetical protein